MKGIMNPGILYQDFIVNCTVHVLVSREVCMHFCGRSNIFGQPLLMDTDGSVSAVNPSNTDQNLDMFYGIPEFATASAMHVMDVHSYHDTGDYESFYYHHEFQKYLFTEQS